MGSLLGVDSYSVRTIEMEPTNPQRIQIEIPPDQTITLRGQVLSKICLWPGYNGKLNTYYRVNQTKHAILKLLSNEKVRRLLVTKRELFLSMSKDQLKRKVIKSLSDRRRDFRVGLINVLTQCNFDLNSANLINISIREANRYLAEFICLMENLVVSEENAREVMETYLDFKFEKDVFEQILKDFENCVQIKSEDS